MRLIDADSVIDDTKWEMGETYDDDVRAGMKSVIDIINKRRTAYDVDKVVSELQDKSFERYGNQGMGGELVVNFDDAVEIVKRGGVDERQMSIQGENL